MSESQSDFWVDLNLVDSRQLVLDRILGRDNLHVRFVDLDQRTVQGCCFTRSGWAGDQDDAVRQRDQLAEYFVSCFGHAQTLKLKLHRAFV